MGIVMRRQLDEKTGKEVELEGIHIIIFNYTGEEILAIKNTKRLGKKLKD